MGRIAGSRSGSKLSWLRSICVAAAVLAAEADFHPLRARGAFGADLADQRGHLVQLAGADDQVDVRGPLEDDPLVFLRHAAQDADHFVADARAWRF